MDVDSPRPPAPSKAAVGLTRPAIGVPATAKVSDVIQTFRPTRVGVPYILYGDLTADNRPRDSVATTTTKEPVSFRSILTIRARR